MSAMTLTQENFEQQVLQATQPVLVDFWASWCGPCKMLSPVIDELSQEADGAFRVGKVNIDQQPDLASRFEVMSIPTLVVFKDGKPVSSSVGVQSKESILGMLNQ